jgi:hypothetical protein
MRGDDDGRDGWKRRRLLLGDEHSRLRTLRVPALFPALPEDLQPLLLPRAKRRHGQPQQRLPVQWRTLIRLFLYW